MPDELFNRIPPQPSRRGKGRSIFGIVLLVLAVGAGLAGWLAYDGKLRFDPELLASKPQTIASQPIAAASINVPTTAALRHSTRLGQGAPRHLIQAIRSAPATTKREPI